jgi:F0F1-type ATP synthase assembly protein I
MKAQRQAAIVAGIRSILTDVYSLESECTYSPGHQRYLQISDDQSERQGTMLDKLVDHVLKERTLADKFSKATLKGSFVDLVEMLCAESTQYEIEESVDHLVQTLHSYDIEQRVYIPLSGMVLFIDSVSIGPFTIRYMSDDRAEQMKEAIHAACYAPEYPAPHMADMYQQTFSSQIDLLKDRVFAEYRVIAEQKAAMPRAKKQVQQLVEFLRYGLFFIGGGVTGLVVGIEGEHIFGTSHFFLIPSTYLGSSHSSEQPHVWRKMPINEDAVQRLEHAGVFTLGEMLTRSNLSEFERTLLQAVHWCADARSQMTETNQFLSLVVCVETLFTPERGGNSNRHITDAIAESVAIMLADDGGTYEWWKSIAAHVYDRRSRVSHGQLQDITSLDLRLVTDLVKRLLPKLIQRGREFRKREDLLSWLSLQQPVSGDRK